MSSVLFLESENTFERTHPQVHLAQLAVLVIVIMQTHAAIIRAARCLQRMASELEEGIAAAKPTLLTDRSWPGPSPANVSRPA